MLNKPDLINGLFEFSGALAGLFNIVVLYRDKQVRGFAPAVYIYFTSWAAWNLYYYSNLLQWISLFGTIAILLSNGVFTSMALYYTWRNRNVQQDRT